MDTKLRAKVVERDRFKCRGCANAPDEIHHIIFRSQGGTDDPSNLISLCRSCHAQAHGRRNAPLPAWTLQATLLYNKWRVCCGIWKFFRTQANCITCDNRSADYQCLLLNEEVDPLDGCGSWLLRSLSVQR